MSNNPSVKRHTKVVVKRKNLSKDKHNVPMAYPDIKKEWFAMLQRHILSEIDIHQQPYIIRAEWLAAMILTYQARQTLIQLRHHYPNCFDWQEPKPLKSGILYDLAKTYHVHKRPFKQCQQALKYYTHTKLYLAQIKANTCRINLQGKAVGKVTEAQENHAKESLTTYCIKDGVSIKSFIEYSLRKVKKGKSNLQVDEPQSKKAMDVDNGR